MQLKNCTYLCHTEKGNGVLKNNIKQRDDDFFNLKELLLDTIENLFVEY